MSADLGRASVLRVNVMKIVENVVVTDRAAAIFQLDSERRRPKPDDVIALYFMPSFKNADGTTVDGFAPGYTIDYVGDRAFNDRWVMGHLPDGTSFRFMPKFDWRADATYVLDGASGYTFSVGLQ